MNVLDKLKGFGKKGDNKKPTYEELEASYNELQTDYHELASNPNAKAGKTLINAYKKIKELEQAVNQLSAEPLGFATVLTLVTTITNTKPEYFQKGTRVRLKAENPDVQKHPGKGTVLGDQSFGWVKVIFDDDESRKQYAFRIGETDPNDPELALGECDLDIVDIAGQTTISYGGMELSVLVPFGMELQPGDTVKVSSKTQQILSVEHRSYTVGPIAKVNRVIDDNSSEIEIQGQVRVVLNSHLIAVPESGDQVILDNSMSIIINNLGKDENRFSIDDTNVEWSDIGGLQDAKLKMQEAVISPHKNKGLYLHYGKKPLKGILLYGVPGCGKTLLGKALAANLAEVYNAKKTRSGFMYIKGPEILNRYVGESEAAIRGIFERAREHRKKYNFPAVVFIDEADSIMYERGTGRSSDVDRTIVPAFLAEMDGMQESDAIVIIATNRPDVLDPAITREGRIDRKIKVTRPTYDDAINIFKIYLGKIPCVTKDRIEKLAKFAAGQLFSQENALYKVNLNGDYKGQHLDFTLGEICSGAVIFNIVDKATSRAISRDVASNEMTTLTEQDIAEAVQELLVENADLNHTAEVNEFIKAKHRDKDVIGMEKVQHKGVSHVHT